MFARKKNTKKENWLSEETLQIAVKREEAKSKADCAITDVGSSVRLGEPHSEKDTQGQPLVD